MWPIQLAFRFLISCRIFLCSLTLSSTSSFLTWSVQLIFSILLQHHISKPSRYFWSAARSVPSFSTVQSHAPNTHKALGQYRYCLIIEHLSCPVDAGLKEFYLSVLNITHLPWNKHTQVNLFPTCCNISYIKVLLHVSSITYGLFRESMIHKGHMYNIKSWLINGKVQIEEQNISMYMIYMGGPKTSWNC